MSYLDNLWNKLKNPKGNLGDFQHAARLYNSNVFRLAPKFKFLYHVVFNVSPSVSNKFGNFGDRHLSNVNLLVRSVDLPRFKIDVQTLNQYNRKKNFQTKLNYEPITIAFHDDNIGVTTQFWNLYYGYYFADNRYNNNTSGSSSILNTLTGILNSGGDVQNLISVFNGKPNATIPAAYQQNSYKSSPLNSYRYGLDNDSSDPFFTSIQIFQMSRREYQCFTLVRPIVSSWQHDTMDQDDASGTVQSRMTINYEAVFYNKGLVSNGALTGFGEDYYDKGASPLSLLGGGTSTVFGEGGIYEGVSDMLSDVLSGKSFGSVGGLLGTLVQGTNLAKNIGNLSSEGLRNEQYQIFNKSINAITTSVLGIDVSGLVNMSFPKDNGAGQNQIPQGKTTPVNPGSAGSNEEVQTFLTNHPQAWNTLAKRTAFKTAIGGSANVNVLNDQWNNLSAEQKAEYKAQALSLVYSKDPATLAQYTKIKRNTISSIKSV